MTISIRNTTIAIALGLGSLTAFASTADKLAAAVLQWFEHPDCVAGLHDDYRRLHLELRRDASASAAEAVARLLAQREPGTGNRESEEAGS